MIDPYKDTSILGSTVMGAVLVLLRENAGLTQAELAERVGLSRSTVAHMETGRTYPSMPVVFGLELALTLPSREPRGVYDGVRFFDGCRVVASALRARGVEVLWTAELASDARPLHPSRLSMEVMKALLRLREGA